MQAFVRKNAIIITHNKKTLPVAVLTKVTGYEKLLIAPPYDVLNNNINGYTVHYKTQLNNKDVKSIIDDL